MPHLKYTIHGDAEDRVRILGPENWELKEASNYTHDYDVHRGYNEVTLEHRHGHGHGVDIELVFEKQ